MHLLGDVGAGEINDHRALVVIDGCHAKAGIADALAHFSRQHLRFDRQVDESRPSDLRRGAERHERFVRLQLLGDGCCDGAGGLLERFGQGQGAVGLKVAELGFAGWSQGRIEGAIGVWECPRHGSDKLLLEGLGEAQHGRDRCSGINSP